MRSALLAIALLVPATAPAGVPVIEYKLDNGMQVVVIEDRRVPVVTHMVWYPVGAADEPWGKSGIAHFFEHLMFKGTDEIPEGAFSKIVAANGGQDNAFTSYDYTAYFQRIASDRLGIVMGMEADRMRDLVLDEAIVATERDVILEERSQRTDNSPQALFGEQLRAALYQNHPYGIPVIGWRHEMETLNLEDAKAFYARYYAPDNAILVVAGDVEPERVLALAKEHYGPLEPSGNPPAARPQEPPQRTHRRIDYADPRVRQPYVLRYYLAPSRVSGDPAEAAALEVLSQILGAGITSRFAARLERGDRTAIETGAWYSGDRRDATSFGIYAVPAEGVSLDTVEAALDAEIARLKVEGVSAEEVDRVKRRVRADYIYGSDSQRTLANRYGAALAVGLTVADVAAWPDLVAAVTPEAVVDVARRHLVLDRAVTGHLTTKTREEG